MKTWLRRTLIGVLSLVVLLALVVAGLVWNGERKRDRLVALPALKTPALVDAAAARERGAYLYASRGCVDCHGADGAGRVFVDNGSLRIKGPAIHTGPGSVTLQYKPEDWDRVLRHGVKPNGRPAMIMPSEDYNRFATSLNSLENKLQDWYGKRKGACESISLEISLPAEDEMRVRSALRSLVRRGGAFKFLQSLPMDVKLICLDTLETRNFRVKP